MDSKDKLVIVLHMHLTLCQIIQHIDAYNTVNSTSNFGIANFPKQHRNIYDTIFQKSHKRRSHIRCVDVRYCSRKAGCRSLLVSILVPKGINLT